MSDETPPDAEKIDTSISLNGMMRLFRDHANRALDPHQDMREDHALENIRDACEAVLEDE